MRATLIAVIFAAAPAIAAAPKVTVEIDNAWVHTSRVILDPHEKLPMREYAPSVVVSVTDGKAAWFDEGSRIVANSSDKLLEEVIIELKSGAPPFPSHPITLDPVKLDPKYHTVDFENARVRVLRTVLEPHVKSPVHDHPAYVVVYLTELHTTMAVSDGRLLDNVRRKGEVAWRDAMRHSTENIGSQTAMEIQVELK